MYIYIYVNFNHQQDIDLSISDTNPYDGSFFLGGRGGKVQVQGTDKKTPSDRTNNIKIPPSETKEQVTKKKKEKKKKKRKRKTFLPV